MIHSIASSLCRTATACALCLLAACATPPPVEPNVLAKPQLRTLDGVTVAVAMLGDSEAHAAFGADLAAHEVQAAWIEVRNASLRNLWFIRNQLDPDFYSPDEVAQTVGGRAASALRQRLRDEAMRVFLPAGTVSEGYVFLPRVEGGRFLDVSLQGDAWDESAKAGARPHPRELRFGFTVALPDGDFDFETFAPERVYAGRTLADLDEQALRAALKDLPCCTTDRGGENEGDPLNLVLVGSAEEVLSALTRAGWSFTHRLDWHSVEREIGAALTGAAYPVAPVSKLFVFGRGQDLALQRARRTIAQRNHLRLWLAPFRFEGREVWIGQVSRDIGVKLTTKSPTFTTHVIDPEVDATREYLLHSLLAQRLVSRFGFAGGSAAATPQSPRHNLTDDPYFSDGLRLVLVLSREPVPVEAIRNLQWERSAAPIAEGQSPDAARHVRPLDAPPRPN